LVGLPIATIFFCLSPRGLPFLPSAVPLAVLVVVMIGAWSGGGWGFFGGSRDHF